jgi:hypothetical protein
VLEALDVLAGNADVYHSNANSGLLFGLPNGPFDGVYSLVNVEHDAARNPFGHGFAHAQDFEFAELVFAAHQGTNFCGTNVEPDDDFILLHGNSAGEQ